MSVKTPKGFCVRADALSRPTAGPQPRAIGPWGFAQVPPREIALPSQLNSCPCHDLVNTTYIQDVLRETFVKILRSNTCLKRKTQKSNCQSIQQDTPKRIQPDRRIDFLLPVSKHPIHTVQ